MSYTNGLDDPSAHFQTKLYTGTGNSLALTNDGNSDLKPDFAWIKRRDGAYSHALFDSSRGSTERLVSNLTQRDDTNAQYITSFNTDGFTAGTDANINGNNLSYVGWQWKANGGTTTSVSASGTGNGCINACTHQANTTAGFSIITYTGRDDQLNNAHESKLTHGLGVAPSVFICKRRDGTSNWYYLGGNMGTVNNGWNNAHLLLNQTAAVNGNYYTSNTEPDSTYIYLGNQLVNTVDSWVGYAFAEKQGYSKFGRYEGNSNVNGPFIYTGFKPAFVMVKPIDIAEHWVMMDSTRDEYNGGGTPYVFANASEGEQTAYERMDFLSNGFKIRTSNNNWNASSTVIYMAFAENPFTTSTGIPTTAR